jgi:RNA polymerase subunit RPABC4/transcription elongation factor Spt4
MEINCDECMMQDTDACDDCVVTYIVGRQPGEAIVIDVEEERAVRMLADAGLVPELRHRRARVG